MTCARGNFKRLAIVLAIVPVLMGSKCKPDAAITCPPLRSYSDTFLSELADEVEAIKDSGLYPHVELVIVDFRVTRDAIRACRAARAKAR